MLCAVITLCNTTPNVDTMGWVCNMQAVGHGMGWQLQLVDILLKLGHQPVRTQYTDSSVNGADGYAVRTV
jgi:hypothetical protein